MSNLQVLARRCPVMGKALAVQSAKSNNALLGGVFRGTRAYTGKAEMHTARVQRAMMVEPNLESERRNGKNATDFKLSGKPQLT